MTKTVATYSTGIALYKNDDFRVVDTQGYPPASETIIETAKRISGPKVIAPNGYRATRWQGTTTGTVYLVFRDWSALEDKTI